MKMHLPRQDKGGYAKDGGRDEACRGRSALRRLVGIVGKTITIMAVAMIVGWSAYSLTAADTAAWHWKSARSSHLPMHTGDVWNRLALGFR